MKATDLNLSEMPAMTLLRKQSESVLDEDIASVAEVAAMAAVAGLAAPVMMAMIKAAYKTGKGINAIRKIANRAGVKLADRVMGETFTDKQALSLYNPDSKTYRYTTGGGRIPNSKSISKKDITAKNQRTDFPDDNYEPDMLAGVNKEQLEKAVEDSLGTLQKREELVLRARFGLKPFTQDHTLEQVGNAMDIGPERVRQIEARALRKLKHPSRSRKLRGFMDEARTDPMDKEVQVRGVGVYKLSSVQKNIADKLEDLANKAKTGDPYAFRQIKHLIDRGTLQVFLDSLIIAYNDLARQTQLRSKFGEAEEQEIPVNMDGIRDLIQRFESKGYLTPEKADEMRRATQALASGRDTLYPNAILQLLTMVA